MDISQYKGVIERYRDYLPVSSNTPVISLLEGNTPLIPSVSLGKKLGLRLYFKFEGVNPTGSFKDRGMTMAVSKAVEAGNTAVICASTGNTSASAAAYAARAGLKALVLIPEGKITVGKLAQALIHNARVVQIKGNFDTALQLVRDICEKHQVALVNSVNPYRIEGQKTAAFEIIDTLGEAPEYQALPVGNAGNITAYWKGYKEYYQKKKMARLPRMLGFQAEGAAPIVLGHPVTNPETIATAIRIGNPASWQAAVAARDESGGLINTVSDKEITEASKRLAGEEGVFAEPASAASIAGLLKLSQTGYFSREALVVVILTGHGLKDPQFAISECRLPEPVAPDLETVAEACGLRPPKADCN
ncbi:MAG: threonine synthase [Candidatus Omnitrophota bacterium]|nr:threonine synthase [Candidatus Omnitrophota bacterium]